MNSHRQLGAVILLLLGAAGAALAAPAPAGTLEAAARAGDSEAQYRLALQMLYGEGVDPKTRDVAGALAWIRRAAEQGHLEAQKDLGARYEMAIGVPEDAAESARWYRRAAEQGDAEARYHLGLAFDRGHGVAADRVEALRLFRLAADQGYPSAQVELAERFALGDGIARDDAQAARWYRRAAESGHAEGQRALGDLYLAGRGVAKDPSAAAGWYRKSADQAYPFAMERLGMIYELGLDGPANPVCAYLWYALAADHGGLLGKRLRDELAAKVPPGSVAEGRRLAAASVVSERSVEHPFCPGELLTLHFRAAELGDVLAIIARQAALRLAGDCDPATRVKFDIDDRPWEEALTALLGTVGLTWRRSGDQLIVERPRASSPSGAPPHPSGSPPSPSDARPTPRSPVSSSR